MKIIPDYLRTPELDKQVENLIRIAREQHGYIARTQLLEEVGYTELYDRKRKLLHDLFQMQI